MFNLSLTFIIPFLLPPKRALNNPKCAVNYIHNISHIYLYMFLFYKSINQPNICYIFSIYLFIPFTLQWAQPLTHYVWSLYIINICFTCSIYIPVPSDMDSTFFFFFFSLVSVQLHLSICLINLIYKCLNPFL